MPGLFSRRSRSVSTSRPSTPASSSAQSAAAQAFLANRSSQSNLSASAAAAALRSMTPPPTAVDQIQTKRMLNRQGSTSSPNNAPRGRSKGNVQRRSSSASMTERTFRSPSPGRPSTSSGGETTHNSAGFVPPVPQVPEDYSNVPPIPQKSHRRAASVDNFSQRLTKDQAGRVQSVDRGGAPAAPHTASVAAQKVAVPQTAPELERSNSSNSYNFSYPRGARPNSPPPSAQMKQSETSSPLRNGITAAEAQDIQYELNHTSQQPVKKKKKRVDRQIAEGSHLHTGTMGGKPTVTPLAPGPQPEQQEQVPMLTAPVKKQNRKAAITGQASHFPPSPVSPTTDSADSDSDASLDRTRDQRSKRASGLLMKQPSVVREDWEGEQEEERSSPRSYQTTADLPSPPSSVQGRKVIPEANVARKIEEATGSSRSPEVVSKSSVHSSVTTPVATAHSLGAPESAGQERSLSRSPSRSAKFSNNLSTDITTGMRHEPPGRSVSPGKSALKHHSPSPQGTSPLIAEFPRGRDSSPSEATDASTEGTVRRKKAVHVSFDSKPEFVGTAAEPSTPDESVIVSPQNRESNKKWFGLKNKPTSYAVAPSEENPEEVMGHRPQLPTFGSVRKNRRDDAGDNSRTAAVVAPLQSTSRSSSSSSSSQTEPPTLNTSISSDHAIGNVLAQEAQLKSDRESRSPLPPQVTSVEGTGFASESDSDSSDEEASDHHEPKSVLSEKLVESDKRNELPESSDVPVIAVQPATPGLDEIGKPTDQWLVDVPGGFPEASDQPEDASRDNHKIQSDESSTGLGIGASKPSPNVGSTMSSSAKHAQQRVEADPDESSSDNDSIYSDAEEDLSDLEGDGFGSIDAVVHSPISPSGRMSSPPESPLAAIPEDAERPGNVQRTASWQDTQARWSNIAQQAKKASLQPAAEISGESQPRKSKKKKKTRTSDLPSRTPVASLPPASSDKDPQYESPLRAPNQSSSYPIIANKSSRTANQGGFRKSMRSEPEQAQVADTKRYSMPIRSENPPKAFRSSMRTSLDSDVPRRHFEQPIQAVQAVSRPTVEPKTEQNTRTLRKPAVPLPTAADSDSESSFKRRRRSKKPQDGKYTMKRSMRAAPATEPPPPKRGVIRSLSPISRRPTSPVGGQSTMRTTLRGSMDAGTPTLRGQQQGKRSSLFGFGSREKSPLRPTSPTPMTAKFKSRVDDSDDEDGARPTAFKSRFGDSSDEDEPARLRPVRGIPRKADDGDSTDLEDSSDDEGKRSKQTFTGQKRLQIQSPSSPLPGEAAEPASPNSPTSKKKRGIFGLFKKNKDDSPRANAAETISSRNATDLNITNTDTGEVSATQLGFHSEAERDAMVEQMQKKLEAAKARSTSPVGKLQRRMTPQRIMSDTFLPPKMPAATNEDRPSTSDAVPNGSPLRPDLGSRQPTTDTVSTSAVAEVYGRSGKKKKFPLLRRAFGLKD